MLTRMLAGRRLAFLVADLWDCLAWLGRPHWLTPLADPRLWDWLAWLERPSPNWLTWVELNGIGWPHWLSRFARLAEGLLPLGMLGLLVADNLLTRLTTPRLTTPLFNHDRWPLLPNLAWERPHGFRWVSWPRCPWKGAQGLLGTWTGELGWPT